MIDPLQNDAAGAGGGGGAGKKKKKKKKKKGGAGGIAWEQEIRLLVCISCLALNTLCR